jgi:hypothetical protein
MALPAHSRPWPLIQFRTQTVGLLGRVISPSHGLYLNTGQHKHRINAYTHTPNIHALSGIRTHDDSSCLRPRGYCDRLHIIFFSLALQPPWALASAFQFHDHFTDGRTPWRVISSSQGLYLNTGQHKHRINAYTHQTSMSCVGFEPTIPASQQAKKFMPETARLL